MLNLFWFKVCNVSNTYSLGLKFGKVLSDIADAGVWIRNVVWAPSRQSLRVPGWQFLRRAQALSSLASESFVSAMGEGNCLGLEIQQSIEYICEGSKSGSRDD